MKEVCCLLVQEKLCFRYSFFFNLQKDIVNRLGSVRGQNKTLRLPVGESNPGLPRDKRGYSPLY